MNTEQFSATVAQTGTPKLHTFDGQINYFAMKIIGPIMIVFGIIIFLLASWYAIGTFSLLVGIIITGIGFGICPECNINYQSNNGTI